MATNNSVNTPLSGSTGTVNFVGSSSPTLITPTLGAATATSIGFSPTTGGISGSTAGDNASSGFVGQIISSAFSSAVAISSGVTTQIQVLSIPAGDWDIWGTFATAPAGSTVPAGLIFALNLNTATISAPNSVATSNIFQYISVQTAGQAFYGSTGIYPLTVSGSTNIFLNANISYSASTLTAGGIIIARRRR